MSNTYQLVNPYIKGEFKTKLKTKNSVEAAKRFYKNLSEHFNNNVPRYYFTIQKGSSGNGKYYHFEVREKKVNEEVSYSIRPYDIKGKDNMKGFLKNFNKDSDDDSSSSESDYYREARSYVPTISQPFYHMYYDPFVYNLDTFYLPTFYAYATPYVIVNSSGYHVL